MDLAEKLNIFHRQFSTKTPMGWTKVVERYQEPATIPASAQVPQPCKRNGCQPPRRLIGELSGSVWHRLFQVSASRRERQSSSSTKPARDSRGCEQYTSLRIENRGECGRACPCCCQDAFLHCRTPYRRILCTSIHVSSIDVGRASPILNLPARSAEFA